MPAFHIQRSIVIGAAADKVFDTVADFTTWPRWSPWLPIDKQAVVTFSEDPRSENSIYRWMGELVGAGEIEHIKLDRPTKIQEQIRFTKPFKSKSDVSFELESHGDSTKITWHMNGSLPWFMFWMRSSMETYVGMDYERGLKMLREFVETGEVLSDVDVMGVEPVEPFDVYGVRESTSIDQISKVMEKAVSKVTELFRENGIADDGEMVTVYHPVDLKEQRFDFTAGFTVRPSGDVPEGLRHVHVAPGRALRVKHTGSYQNLGNAWSGAYQYARYKKIKVARRDGFEFYRNDPQTTPPAQWVTEIYVPVK